MSITVEKMENHHCAAVALLEKECFSEPWSEKALADGISRADAGYFVAVDSGEVVGYIGSHSVVGEVSVTNIAVTSRFRRKGVAQALLDRLKEECRDDEFITLEVRASNNAAISLYEKNGFIKVGTRKNFYSTPAEDALLYTFFIGDES